MSFKQAEYNIYRPDDTVNGTHFIECGPNVQYLLTSFNFGAKTLLKFRLAHPVMSTSSTAHMILRGYGS